MANKYEESKIKLSEEKKKEFGQVAISLAESWNSLMESLEKDHKEYILKFKGDAAKSLEELCAHLNLPYHVVVEISLRAFIQSMRGIQQAKTFCELEALPTDFLAE